MGEDQVLVNVGSLSGGLNIENTSDPLFGPCAFSFTNGPYGPTKIVRFIMSGTTVLGSQVKDASYTNGFQNHSGGWY